MTSFAIDIECINQGGPHLIIPFGKGYTRCGEGSIGRLHACEHEVWLFIFNDGGENGGRRVGPEQTSVGDSRVLNSNRSVSSLCQRFADRLLGFLWIDGDSNHLIRDSLYSELNSRFYNILIPLIEIIGEIFIINMGVCNTKSSSDPATSLTVSRIVIYFIFG